MDVDLETAVRQAVRDRVERLAAEVRALVPCCRQVVPKDGPSALDARYPSGWLRRALRDVASAQAEQPAP
jgi:hypothetical protein